MHRLGSCQELVSWNPEVHGTIPLIGVYAGGAASGARSKQLATAELPLPVPGSCAVVWRVEASQDMSIPVGAGALRVDKDDVTKRLPLCVPSARALFSVFG